MPVRSNPMFLSLCLSAALATASCGGGSPDSPVEADQPVADTPSDLLLLAGDLPTESSAVTSASCGALPAIPARPAHTRSVTEFGVKPNDSADHTDAIQRAL